jgi:hypothetical protein
VLFSRVRVLFFPNTFPSVYVNEGMVATATRTILENLDRLPNDDQRTKVAIVAYDTSVYFFSMSVSLSDFSCTPGP